MANKFVWSGATGANDGSSWGDAYVTLMKDWGAEAGFTPGTDFVYVRSTHDETLSADSFIIGTTAEGTLDPVRVLCVTGNDTGTDPGTLTTGAEINTNDTYDININEKIYIYGVDFLAGEDLHIGITSNDHNVFLEQCRLELAGVAGTEKILICAASVNYGLTVNIVDCNIDFGATGQYIRPYGGRCRVVGGSVLADVSNFLDFINNVSFEFSCVDLSLIDGNLVNTANIAGGCGIKFVRCKINASATLVSGTIDVPGVEISFHHCQSGTDADPAYQMKRYTYQGTVETDTARYRTSGASDGERTNPYSLSMDTSAGSNVIELYEPLESPVIRKWTGGDGSTAHTYRIYVASGATLQNDECWVELIGPNDAAEDSLGVRKTTRPDPMATPANLTTDASSTWNGADVTTKQYIDITYTPDKPGPVTARIYLAKPGERVSVDPRIDIDPS